MKRRRLLLSCSIFLLTAFEVGSLSTSVLAQKKKLVMGTSPDYPPYEFYAVNTKKEKEIIGFDIDIARYILSKLGYTLDISGMSFDDLIPALEAKRVDFVMAGMTPTEERQKIIDFSEVYFDAKDTIVAKKGNNLTEPKTLTGKVVGVQLGTVQEEVAKKLKEKEKIEFEVVALSKITDLIQEIKLGRIDAAIIEDAVTKGFVAANPDLEFNILEKQDEEASGSAIAFPKGSPLVADFNRILKEMKDNGELDKLAEKWFSTSISP
jgi:polar amino acid transport system substrate-binding protein